VIVNNEIEKKYDIPSTVTRALNRSQSSDDDPLAAGRSRAAATSRKRGGAMDGFPSQEQSGAMDRLSFPAVGSSAADE
jgi:hypothetical protein